VIGVYSNALGRFINRDIIGERGAVNLFAYVLNNPVSLIDPCGFQACGLTKEVQVL
jgi:RHS repeat-associated protein